VGSHMFEEQLSPYHAVVKEIVAHNWREGAAQEHFFSAFGLVMGNVLQLRDQHQGAFDQFVEEEIEAFLRDVNGD